MSYILVVPVGMQILTPSGAVDKNKNFVAKGKATTASWLAQPLEFAYYMLNRSLSQSLRFCIASGFCRQDRSTMSFVEWSKTVSFVEQSVFHTLSRQDKREIRDHSTSLSAKALATVDKRRRETKAQTLGQALIRS